MSEQELKQRLYWIIRARWIVLGILVAVGLGIHWLTGVVTAIQVPPLLLALAVAAYNLILQRTLARPLAAHTLQLLSYLQSILDLLVFTALIHYSGGIESPFLLFYFLQVLVAGFILPAGGAYAAATLAALLYGGLLFAEYAQIIPHFYAVHRYTFSAEIYQDASLLLTYLVIVTGWLYAAAFLTDYLAGLMRAREKRIQEQASEQSALYGLARALTEARDRAAVYARATAEVARLVGAQRCLIALFDIESGWVRGQAPAYGLDDTQARAFGYVVDDEVVAVWNIAQQDTLLVNDIALVPRSVQPLAAQMNVHCFVAVRLFVRGDYRAILFAADKPGGFTPGDTHLLAIAGPQVAMALERVELMEEAQRSYETERQARQVAEALKKYLENLIASSPDVIATTDQRGILTFVSPGVEKATGYKPEEQVGQPVWKYYVEGKAEAHKVMNLLRQQGEVRGYETWFWHKDGRKIPVSLSASLLKDEQGNVIGTLGVLKDLTERKKAEEEIRRRLAREERLNELAHAVGGEMELATLIPRLLPLVTELTGADAATMAIPDPERQVITYPYHYHLPQALAGMEVPAGTGLAWQTMQAGQPILLDDYREHPAALRPWVEAGVRSILTVPLLVGDQVVGSLGLFSLREVRPFAPEAVAAAQAAGRLAALAIQRARLFEGERQQRREAQTLREAALALTTSLDRNEVVERILSELQQVVPYDSASIQLLKGDRLEIIGGRGFPNLPEIVGLTFHVEGNNPNREVVRTRAPFIVADGPAVYADFRREPHAQAHIRSWLGAPMLVGERLIGMITLDKREPAFYTEAHARLALAFASQAAIVIENARLFEEERRRAAQLAVVNAVGRHATATLRLDELLRNVTSAIQTGFHYYNVSTFLVEGEYAILKAIAGGFAPVVKHDYRQHLSQGIIGWAITHNQTVLANDVSQDPHFIPGFLEKVETRSELCVPIRVDDQVLGALDVQSVELNAFDQSDAKALEALADEVALALKNALAYGRLDEEKGRLELLYAVAAEVNRSLDLDEILARAIERITTGLGGKVGYVFLVDPGTDRLRLRAVSGADVSAVELDERLEVHVGQGVVGWVAAHGEPAVVDDVTVDARWLYVDELDRGIRSVMSVPLMRGEQVLGALSVLHPAPRFFGEAQCRLLMAIGQQVAVAVANAWLHETVQQQAMLDSLTQVYNHGELIRRLHAAVAEAAKENWPVSFIMLDIDFFKEYNDHYGHVTGDLILKAIVQAIRVNIKKNDVVGRWGGEEFGILLPRTDTARAQIVAERIRHTLAAMDLRDDHDRQIPKPTVSQGIAAYPATATTADALIDRADAALYRAKARGKDQVQIFDFRRGVTQL